MRRELLFSAALLMTGCTIEGDKVTPDGGAVFVDTGAPTTDINGFSYDPEAFFLSVFACGPTCSDGPEINAQGQHWQHAAVLGSTITLIDANDGSPAATTTAEDGTWLIEDFPSRFGGPPYLVFSSGGTLSDGPEPTIPKADYVDTLVLRPVMPNYGVCFLQESSLLSTTGILQAVARHLTANGTATTVDDLMDPAQYGGVAVWWLYEPGTPNIRFPAFNTGVTADMGTAYQINWAPPGDENVPPGEQSDRGFFVDPREPVSGIGLSVIVLPAAPPGPPLVPTFTFTDPSGRLGFPDLPSPVLPGANFGPLQLGPAPTGNEEPSGGSDDLRWVCFP